MDQDQPANFYSNNVSAASSLYDVTLQFTTQTPVITTSGKQPPQQVVIEQGSFCNVRMSPQHAKALVTILIQQIAQYETQFNLRLPLTPDLQVIWDTYIKEQKK